MSNPITHCQECGEMLFLCNEEDNLAICENARYERGCSSGKLIRLPAARDLKHQITMALPNAIWNAKKHRYEVGKKYFTKGRPCFSRFEVWGKVIQAAWFGGKRGGATCFV